MTSTPRPPGPGRGPSPASEPPAGPEPGPRGAPGAAQPDTSTDVPSAGPGSAGTSGPSGAGGGQKANGDQDVEAFFRRIEGLGIVRQDENRWIGGVCAGISRRFGIDPILIRGLLVALAVVGGFGLGLYGIAWALLPQTNGVIHAREATRGRVSSGLVGAVFCVLLDIGSLTGRSMGYGGTFWFAPGGLLILILIALGLWWMADSGRLDYKPSVPDPAGAAGRSGQGAAAGTPYFAPPGAGGAAGATSPPGTDRDDPVPGAPAPGWGSTRAWRRDSSAPLHSLTSAVLGVALLAGGGVLLWDRVVQEVTGSPGIVALAVALAVVSCGVVLAGALGRRGGALAPVTILLMIASLSTAVSSTAGHDVVWRPARPWQSTDQYTLGIGEAVLDLTAPGILPGEGKEPFRVSADVGAGRMKVLVPGSVSTEVRSAVGLGAIEEHSPTPADVAQRDEWPPDGARHTDYEGFGLSHRTFFGGSEDPQVIVSANLGVGTIEIIPVEAVNSHE
ncbi:MAG: hypothetical protein QG608_872 [Actinomycetota bacterium]|nr:hypothetical protein [Actinomycetota bacterium]